MIQKRGDFMTAKDKEAFIKNKLFSTVDINEYKESVEFVSAKKGEKVMTTDSFSRCLVLIISGKAAVSKTGLDGKRTIINSLSAGDVFGMATLFYEKDEYPSDITAESDLRLAVLKKETVENIFADNPDFAKAYVTLLSEKIHFLNKKLAAFSEGDIAEKLLHWILVAADGKKEFEIPCSLSKLSAMLNVGRASLYRAFDTLSERGEIVKDGKKIVILKP